MKTRPFIIATAAGATTQIIWTITNIIISYTATNTAQGFPQPGVTPTDPFSTVGTALLLAIGLVCGPALYLLVGGLYAYLHHRDSPVRAEEGAIGGGTSAASTGFLASIASLAISMFLTPFIMQQVGSEFPVPSVPLIGFAMAFSVIGGFISVCASTVISGTLGAVGGAITAAILNR